MQKRPNTSGLHMPSRGLSPASALAVRESIAVISPSSDGAVNDLDRLAEDLGLGPLERLDLGRALEQRLGRSVDTELVMRAQTVADLMTALG